ncbi:TIM-barrel domain-containing protein [Shigella sonnei]
MAESLRGDCLLAFQGLASEGRDIGGFEDPAPAHVYKRWCAFWFALSHSRLHGGRILWCAVGLG